MTYPLSIMLLYFVVVGVSVVVCYTYLAYKEHRK